MKKLGLILVLFTAACSASVANRAEMPMAAQSFRTNDAADIPDDVPVAVESQQPRKRIVNGSLRLRGENVTELETRMVARVEELGGYVAHSTRDRSSVELSVRIPTERLSAFLAFAEGLGKVESKSQSVTDITSAYTDLETRIQNQQALVARIRRYLNEAKSIQEILEVEQSLNQVTTELESMLAQKTGWDRDIAYSRWDITLLSHSMGEGDPWPDLSRGFSELLANTVWFFYGFFFAVIYLVIFGVPIGVLLLFVVWLLFGKKGLVRRILGIKTKSAQIDQEPSHG